jgi:hypothetical protein
MGELCVLMVTKLCCTGRQEGAVGWGEGIAFTPQCAGNATFSNVNRCTCVLAEEGELLELDGHVGERARCEAAVVGESVAGVGRHAFYGVTISGGGTGAIASATDREPSEEGFDEEGE